MPVRRRRPHRLDRFAWERLSINEMLCLKLGHLHHRPGATGFETVEDLRQAYETNRDMLLVIKGVDGPPDAFFNEPGTRPRSFWKFEAKERPKFIAWRTVRMKHWQVCGDRLLTAKGFKPGDRIGRRKVFELQEDVLRRLGEIGPEEERLLDAIKREEAIHVRTFGPDCRCRVCAKNRTYPHRLQAFLGGSDSYVR